MATYGLVCYDSSGVKTFDSSSNRIARILDVRVLSTTPSSGSYDVLIGTTDIIYSGRTGFWAFCNDSTQYPFAITITSKSCAGNSYAVVNYAPANVSYNDVDLFPPGPTNVVIYIR